MARSTVIGNLLINLRAGTATLEQDFRRAGRDMQKFGRELQSVGADLTRTVTLPILGIGVAALKMSTDFNRGMANVATLIPGNTERVNELKRAVQDAAVATGTSTAIMTDGLYQIVSAFGDSADSAKLLDLNARLAKAGLATVTDAINLTSAVTKGYGDTTFEAQKKVGDLAFQAVKLGQTTFPELAASMGRVVPIAATLGVAQEELFAGFATLTGVTGNASEVSTQLAAVLRAMIKPTTDMSAAVNRLGYESAQAMVEQLGMAGALRALIGTTDGTTESVGKLFGRAEALTTVFALTGSQAGTFDEKLRAMAEASGIADEAFKEQTDGINKMGFAWDQTRERMTVMAQTLGETLGPVIQDTILPLLERMIGGLERLTGWFANLPQPIQNTSIVLAGLAAAAGPVLWYVGSLYTAFGKLLPLVARLPGLLVAARTAMLATTTSFAAFPPILVAIAAGFAAIQWGRVISNLWELGKVQGKINEVSSELFHQTERMRQKLEEVGVVIERGPKEAFESYRARVMEAVKAHGDLRAEAEGLPVTLDRVTSSVDGTTEAIDRSTEALQSEIRKAVESTKVKLDLADAVDHLAAEHARLTDAFRDQIQPANVLAKEIDVLIKHFGRDDVVRVYGDRILEAAARQREFGRALPDSIRELETFILTKRSGEEAAQRYRASLEDLKTTMERLRTEGVSPLSPELQRLINTTKEAVVVHREQGMSAEEARKRVGTLGAQTKETAAQTSEAASQMDRAWDVALGNILSRFTDSMTKMLGVGNSFAKSLLEIFFGQLFKPLMGWMNKMSGAFSKWLGDTIGGALGKIPGLLGKIPGLGFLNKIPGLDFLNKIPGLSAVTKVIPGGQLAELAMMGVGVAFNAVKKLFEKDPLVSGSKEAMRDFGISVPKGIVEAFIGDIGLDKKAFEGIRKDVLSSPQFFAQVLLPAAKATGQVDQLIASFGNLAAFGKTYDFSAAAAQAAAGDFSSLNDQWADLFAQSRALQANMPNWRELLTVPVHQATQAVESLGKAMEEIARPDAGSFEPFVDALIPKSKDMSDATRAMVDAAGRAMFRGFTMYGNAFGFATDHPTPSYRMPSYQSGGYVPETGPAWLHRGETVIPAGRSGETRVEVTIAPHFTIQSRSEDLARTVRDEVAPELVAMLRFNSRGLTDDIRRALEREGR
jgi:TP901 family phage tail tape measure protein